MREPLLVLAGVGVALVALYSLAGNRKAIARANVEAERLADLRDSLAAVVNQNERHLAALTIQRQTQRAIIIRLRDSVIANERRRAASQLDVRRIRTTGALLDRLRATFPELADSAWGLITVTLDDRDTLGLEYLTLPAWFAETFIIDHQNAESWRAQKDRLLAVDSLRLAVSALQDSVVRLTEANAEAYQSGYQAAYTGYQHLSNVYVAELRKPRIRVPSLLGFVGAVGLGVVVGRVLP